MSDLLLSLDKKKKRHVNVVESVRRGGKKGNKKITKCYNPELSVPFIK